MKRENRILKHREFVEILSKYPFEKTSHFVIHYRQNSAEKIRVGINVGKKSGDAVTRNKIKRQIRTLVGAIFDFGKPLDIVILVRPTYSPELYCEAQNELQGLWEKIGEKH